MVVCGSMVRGKQAAKIPAYKWKDAPATRDLYQSRTTAEGAAPLIAIRPFSVGLVVIDVDDVKDYPHLDTIQELMVRA